MPRKVMLAVVAIAVVLYYFWSGDHFEPASIAGKRVLVTGASSGIGEQLAYQYCKLGAHVTIAARRLQRLEGVAKKCRQLGAGQVIVVQADLGRAEDRLKVMKKVRKELGGLDHLLMNHAVLTFGMWLGTTENMTNFLNQLDINFISFVDIASQALTMLTSSKGHIGVVSSIAGKMAIPMTASYSADKFALQGFFSALDQEQRIQGTGVSVTLCIIGPVDTEIGRDLMTEEEWKKYQESIMYNLQESAEDTAMAILRGVATRQREIYYGRIAAILTVLHKAFPRSVESLFTKMLPVDQ